jgi:hypothetical protein
MKKIILLSLIFIVFNSCSKDSNTSTITNISGVPIGTSVKYEVIWNPAPAPTSSNLVNYTDARGNLITLFNIQNPWILNFNTTKENVVLSLNSTHPDFTRNGKVTLRIYINGVIKEEAIDVQSATLKYP